MFVYKATCVVSVMRVFKVYCGNEGRVIVKNSFVLV